MTTSMPSFLSLTFGTATTGIFQWLETPIGGFICNLFYIVFTVVATLFILALSYKLNFVKIFVDKIIKTFASHCITESAVSAIETFSKKFPEVIIEKISEGIHRLVKNISENFAGKTITVDKLVISPKYMDARIVTPEIPRVIYEPELPPQVTSQIPELKEIEELFNNTSANFDKILSKCNEGLVNYSKNKNRYYFNVFKARALITKKDYSGSLEQLNAALKLCTSDAEIYFYIAKCKRHLEDHNEAEDNFKKAIQLNDTESKYFIELGLLYYKWGKIDEAIRAARRAHDLYERDQIDKSGHAYLELHNQLEFYYCMKYDETGDVEYLRLAEDINNWFENIVDRRALNDKLNKGFLNDTMGYFYLMKSIEAKALEKKIIYINKALEIQSKAVEIIPDRDVIERLVRIIRVSLPQNEAKKHSGE